MAASTKKKGKGVSTAREWKRSKHEELPLPSGNTALVKRPGPAALLNEGILPDELTPIVQKAISTGKGLRPEKEADLFKDPKSIAKMLDAMDRLMAVVVVEPPVRYHMREVLDHEGNPRNGIDGKPAMEEIPEEERDTEMFVYTDEVDLDDKMFIFQFAVGGTRDYRRFRSEHSAGMGDVETGEGDSTPSE